MLLRACGWCLAIVLALTATTRAADWPRFGGPTGDQVAPDQKINKDWTARPPKVLWTVPLTDSGHAGPCAADGKVFIVDHRGADDIVRALDLQTGKDLWSFAYPDAAKSRYGFTQSTPLFHQNRLYVFSRLGKALCLDARTGQKLWLRDLNADYPTKFNEFEHASSPALIDGKLILFPGGKGAAVVALDTQTGKTLWQGGGDSRPGYASPVIATLNGQTQIVAFIADGLIALNPADGKQLWAFPWKVPFNQNSATPTVRGNTILFSTAWNKGSGLLDVTNNQPKAIWKNTELQARFPTPVVYQGRIYGTRDPGKLVCLDARSGKLLWSKDKFEFASTLAVDDAVLVLEGKSGNLLLLDASTPDYKELGQFCPLPGPGCWTAPILIDGKLLTRNLKALACIDLR